MDVQLKNKVEKRIRLLGYKKEFVAKQIGLDKVRFSQTLSGVRKITADEQFLLLKFLGL